MGFRVVSLSLGGWGLGFMVQGSVFRFEGLGFKVYGVWCRVRRD